MRKDGKKNRKRKEASQPALAGPLDISSPRIETHRREGGRYMHVLKFPSSQAQHGDDFLLDEIKPRKDATANKKANKSESRRSYSL